MKATRVQAELEVPMKATYCAHCGNPCTYIYGYVDGGRGAVCSRTCDEAYKRRKQNVERNLSEVR